MGGYLHFQQKKFLFTSRSCSSIQNLLITFFRCHIDQMLSCRQIACGGLGARFPAWSGTSSALLSARTSRHTQMCRR